MAPLIVLIVMTLLARGVGVLGVKGLASWPAALRVGLAVMFCFTALAHFNAMREDLIRMVPPWVPDPGLAVTVTGVLEILGGIGLLIPATRLPAAIGLIALLLAVFPANVHAALAEITFRGRPPTPLIARSVLQIAFIAAAFWAGILWRHNGREGPGSRSVSP